MGGDPSGLLSPALAQYQQQLSGLANQNNDPMQTPGMQNLLATIRSDVGNSVNQQFAGAGRDLSGENSQALARGISQGEAAPLLAQYNQNVSNQTGAAGNLYNAAGQTAGALGANQAQGFNFAGALPTLATQGPSAVLQAQAAARGLPLNNLGMLENLTVPIAGLGGQQSGTSNTQGTNTMSGAQQFGAIAGGLGALGGKSGGLGAIGTGLGLLAPLFSDRRLKEDIEKVGELFDGTPVYRFRYLNDPTMHVGLMADEVEKFAPEAVIEIGGYKAVDYALATNRAAGVQ
jgi:hypothetical protein